MAIFRQCQTIWGSKSASVGHPSVFIGRGGNISLHVSNVVSKPEIVMQVLSASPFTTERSYTKHIPPIIYDQGETWSNCNQREGRKGMGWVTTWVGYNVLEFTQGQKPIRYWPRLLNPCPVAAPLKHEKITIRWYSDYSYTGWKYFALLHTHLTPDL